MTLRRASGEHGAVALRSEPGAVALRNEPGAVALRNEYGAVAVAGVLLAGALIVLVGFGIDVAHAFVVRRDLTGIADQAALVGSQQLDIPLWRQGTLALDPETAEQVADTQLSASPDVTGAATAETGSVTVEASESFPTLILRLVGIPTLTVSATVTATPEQP